MLSAEMCQKQQTDRASLTSRLLFSNDTQHLHFAEPPQGSDILYTPQTGHPDLTKMDPDTHSLFQKMDLVATN